MEQARSPCQLPPQKFKYNLGSKKCCIAKGPLFESPARVALKSLTGAEGTPECVSKEGHERFQNRNPRRHQFRGQILKQSMARKRCPPTVGGHRCRGILRSRIWPRNWCHESNPCETPFPDAWQPESRLAAVSGITPWVCRRLLDECETCTCTGVDKQGTTWNGNQSVSKKSCSGLRKIHTTQKQKHAPATRETARVL